MKDKNVLLMVLNCLKRRKSILAGGSKVARLTFQVWNHPLSATSDDILEMNEVPEKARDHRWRGCRDRTGQALMTFNKVTVIEMMTALFQLWMQKYLRTFLLDPERKGMTSD